MAAFPLPLPLLGFLSSFFLSIVLDLSTAPSKLEPNLSISLRLDSNWLTSALLSPGLFPHNNVCARTKLTPETVNHALVSTLFSLTTNDELRQKLITRKAAALPHRNTSAVTDREKTGGRTGPTGHAVVAAAALPLQPGRRPSKFLC